MIQAGLQCLTEEYYKQNKWSGFEKEAWRLLVKDSPAVLLTDNPALMKVPLTACTHHHSCDNYKSRIITFYLHLDIAPSGSKHPCACACAHAAAVRTASDGVRSRPWNAPAGSAGALPAAAGNGARIRPASYATATRCPLWIIPTLSTASVPHGSSSVTVSINVRVSIAC